MSAPSLTETVSKSLDGTGVSFSDDTISSIYDSTLGHPYEMQALCYQLFDSQIKGRVEKDQWDKALAAAAWDMGEDVFENWLARASHQELQVLLALAAHNGAAEVAEIKQALVARQSGVLETAVGKLLRRLLDKGLVENPSRGQYAIPDPMFKVYIRLRAEAQ